MTSPEDFVARQEHDLISVAVHTFHQQSGVSVALGAQVIPRMRSALLKDAVCIRMPCVISESTPVAVSVAGFFLLSTLWV